MTPERLRCTEKDPPKDAKKRERFRMTGHKSGHQFFLASWIRLRSPQVLACSPSDGLVIWRVWRMDSFDYLVPDAIKLLGWNAFAGERSRACGCPGARDVSAFFCRIGSRMRNLPTMSTKNNRRLHWPIRPRSAAIAVMCSSMSSLEHGRRTGHLVYRWQSAGSGSEQPGFGHHNRQLRLLRWPTR
jgi:hypothetical protein